MIVNKIHIHMKKYTLDSCTFLLDPDDFQIIANQQIDLSKLKNPEQNSS